MSPFHLLSQLIGNRFTPIDLVVTPNLIALGLVPSTGTALCPLYAHASDRIHGRYRRVLADLPVCARQLVLIFRLRKFLCANAGCPRRIFCERILDLAAAHARSMARLAQQHRTLGLALGGEPAARLSVKLAMPASGDTILRRVKATGSPPELRYRFVGIDDCALRRGRPTAPCTPVASGWQKRPPDRSGIADLTENGDRVFAP